MSHDFPNADHAQRYHIATLRLALIGTWFIMLALLAVHLWGLRHLKVEVPPDLRDGAIVEVGRTYPHTAWEFAYVVWQQINLWRENGDVEYAANLRSFAPYLTPRCVADLQDDYRRRRSGGALNELSHRARSLIPVGARTYRSDDVVVLAPGAFEVALDFQVYETQRGVPVKDDLYLRYYLRVVDYDTDSQHNPWGIALDCHNRSPEVIDPPKALTP